LKNTLLLSHQNYNDQNAGKIFPLFYERFLLIFPEIQDKLGILHRAYVQVGEKQFQALKARINIAQGGAGRSPG